MLIYAAALTAGAVFCSRSICAERKDGARQVLSSRVRSAGSGGRQSSSTAETIRALCRPMTPTGVAPSEQAGRSRCLRTPARRPTSRWMSMSTLIATISGDWRIIAWRSHYRRRFRAPRHTRRIPLRYFDRNNGMRRSHCQGESPSSSFRRTMSRRKIKFSSR